MTKKIMFSLCFLLGCVQLSFAAKAYPNPWIPEGKNKNQGTLSEGITFDDLDNSGGEIYIYDSLGELVRKLYWEKGNSNVKWDGKNNNGEYVASGVYLWKVKDAGGKVSKLVIIR
ncbi:MAG: T9SS type A sorting domain-containing protein [Endomicrobium sp.]|jgi:flagellar hook assembly protein FlgD|nr:T9SS type A sorting domain-containing protein [Endomicrobium sp.]